MSESELLERYFLKEDIEALGIALQRYTTTLLGIGLKYIKDIHTVQDIVQQVFIKAIEKMPKQVANLGGWLYMVMRNECLDYLRKTSITFVEEFADNKDDDESIEEHWKKVRYEDAMMQHLEQLKEEHKVALQLFYFKEMSYQEIVDKMGWSINEVKSYIQNGKRNLKNKMEQKTNN